MRAVRGRADARWLPSRYACALFRLYALLRFRRAPAQPADVVMVIDRHQSVAESFLVGGWMLLTLAAYVAATLSQWWGLPLALIAAIPLAALLMHVPFTVVGLLLIRKQNNLAVNSVVTFALMTAAATYFARSQSWARYAAWQYLVLVALNAIAAVVVFSLRETIANAESSLGGFTSEL